MSSLKYIGSDGPLTADLVIVGEAPGREEEKLGRPFVGRSGSVLDQMLEHLEVDREEVYITNVVKVRPPGNRTPSIEEVLSWRASFYEEISEIHAKVILCLGRTAARVFKLGDAPLNVQETYWIPGTCADAVVLTYHPAYQMRNPAAKAAVKRDLDLVHYLLHGH